MAGRAPACPWAPRLSRGCSARPRSPLRGPGWAAYRFWTSLLCLLPLCGLFQSLKPARLPDVGQHLSPNAGPLGLQAAHHALAGGKDRDPEATEDSGDLGLSGVDPQAGTADPLHAGDHALAIRPRLEGYLDHLSGPVGILLDFVAGDVALVAQDPRYLELQPGGRDRDVGMPCRVRVPDPGQHVGDGVAHDPHCADRHHQLDLVTPGTRPSAARVRKQIRHIPNFLMYARGRPQMWQRL